MPHDQHVTDWSIWRRRIVEMAAYDSLDPETRRWLREQPIDGGNVAVLVTQAKAQGLPMPAIREHFNREAQRVMHHGR